MRSSNISITGMAAASLICLIATTLSMLDSGHYAKLALFLFAVAGLVFYVAIAMPIRIKLKKRTSGGE